MVSILLTNSDCGNNDERSWASALVVGPLALLWTIPGRIREFKIVPGDGMRGSGMAYDSSHHDLRSVRQSSGLRRLLSFWANLVVVLVVIITELFFPRLAVADQLVFLALVLALIQNILSRKVVLGYMACTCWMLASGAGSLVYFMQGNDLLGTGYAAICVGFGVALFLAWRKYRTREMTRSRQFVRISSVLRSVFPPESPEMDRTAGEESSGHRNN